jgi:hypothetical protein
LVDLSSLNDEDFLHNFAKENNFINFFRTSVKENINVNETMDFLISNIIDRMEKFNNRKTENVNKFDKPTIKLTSPQKTTDMKALQIKKQNECASC